MKRVLFLLPLILASQDIGLRQPGSSSGGGSGNATSIQGIPVSSTPPSNGGDFVCYDGLTTYAPCSLGSLLTYSGGIWNVASESVVQYSSGTSVPGSCPAYGLVFWKTDGSTGQKLYYCNSSAYEQVSGGGGGDASTNTSSSVDGESVLFSGTGGKTLKRSTLTAGVVKSSSGVPSAAASSDIVALFDGGSCGSDYLKGDGTCATPAGGSSSLTPPVYLHGDMWIPSATTNFVSTSANRVFVHPYRKPYSISITRMVWRVTTGNTSGMCGFAVYSGDRSTKLGEVSDDCSAATTNHSVATSSTINLAADTLYWIAEAANDTTLSIVNITTSSNSYLLPSVPNNLVGGYCTSDTANFGASLGSRFPSSCSSKTNLTGATTYPLLWLE